MNYMLEDKNAEILGDSCAREMPETPIVWWGIVLKHIRDNPTIRSIFIEWLNRCGKSGQSICIVCGKPKRSNVGEKCGSCVKLGNQNKLTMNS